MEKDFDTLKLENQLCFPLYAASREILRKYTPVLKKVNLTYTQYIVMMVMWEYQKLTVGELGKKLYLDTGTLSPLLKNMEEKGLVTRIRETSDERVVMVAITEEGEALKEKAAAIPEQMRTCVTITKEEAECLYKILYKLLGEQ